MNIKQMKPILEAVLFAVGEPVESEKLSQALDIDEIVLKDLLLNMQADYEKEDSGLCLLKLDNKFQLCTKPEYADSIRSVIEVKKNSPLSQAAFEVLAIIAYNQPVTKSFIEQIRGVDCSAVVSNLCQKALIEEKGRLDLPGRPLIYGTTSEFLKCFCISSLEELPPLPDESSESQAKNLEIINSNKTDFQLTVDENQNLG